MARTTAAGGQIVGTESQFVRPQTITIIIEGNVDSEETLRKLTAGVARQLSDGVNGGSF